MSPVIEEGKLSVAQVLEIGFRNGYTCGFETGLIFGLIIGAVLAIAGVWVGYQRLDVRAWVKAKLK